MPIRALKIRTTPLPPRRDIPAPAALIRDERPRSVRLCRLGHELRVAADAVQTVGDREGGASQGRQELGYGGLLVSGEDEV